MVVIPYLALSHQQVVVLGLMAALLEIMAVLVAAVGIVMVLAEQELLAKEIMVALAMDLAAHTQVAVAAAQALLGELDQVIMVVLAV